MFVYEQWQQICQQQWIGYMDEKNERAELTRTITGAGDFRAVQGSGAASDSGGNTRRRQESWLLGNGLWAHRICDRGGSLARRGQAGGRLCPRLCLSFLFFRRGFAGHDPIPSADRVFTEANAPKLLPAPTFDSERPWPNRTALGGLSGHGSRGALSCSSTHSANVAVPTWPLEATRRAAASKIEHGSTNLRLELKQLLR